MVRRYCHVSNPEETLLTSSAAPILLLKCKPEASPLADGVAPEQSTLGFMLPYTPLHHLLLAACNAPLVMTSGNISDEPQVIDNKEALTQLASIADGFLLHDRDIINRLDDSVLQMIAGKPSMVRRSRGFAPTPLTLPEGFAETPAIFAAGAELKNNFCLLDKGKAVVSHHIGDMESPSVQKDYRSSVSLHVQARKMIPTMVAIDMHSGYFSSRLGQELAADWRANVIPIQHHHAHIAACMVEHGLPLEHEGVIGVSLDGLGAGEDGGLWGGEFLHASYRTYKRLAHFPAVPIPGGAQCSHEPWRNGFAHLNAALGWEAVEQSFPSLDFVGWMKQKPIGQLQTMIERGLNSPCISSAGRLFDAVAAILDLHRDRVSYEGEAAIALQMLAEQQCGSLMACDLQPYPVSLVDDGTQYSFSWKELWLGLLQDLSQGVSRATIAARFHLTIATLVTELSSRLARERGISTVVLSGGVFQNRLLAEACLLSLEAHGLTVLLPHNYPANDGGISLGQAVIAAAKSS